MLVPALNTEVGKLASDSALPTEARSSSWYENTEEP